jgi:hypothetical protein
MPPLLCFRYLQPSASSIPFNHPLQPVLTMCTPFNRH